MDHVIPETQALHSASSRGAVWKTYALWAGWVGVAFFTVYPTCNWITASRDTFNLYGEWELSAPFIPEFIWIYMSFYILFILPPLFLNESGLRALGKQLTQGSLLAGVIFLALPAKLGFIRTIPEDPRLGAIFSAIFNLDRPHNLVPSLHVVFSALLLWSLRDVLRASVAKLFCDFWLAAICLSTVLVHQHHVLDVITGLLLSWLMRFLNPSSKQGARE